MAKQTLKSLLGNSDEREQVELNLNPIALQPTIRGGGNYRVAVQQTPKTNAALQLSQALKDGVGIYGEAVKTVQSKALQDVATMSEGDFDKFLNEGLDEESRSIFGYTKAYNQALAKKYYNEEMPKKLQEIAYNLHKDPYAYKTPEEFEAASMEAVNGAYDEADELLGGNVFGNQANNALKSATKADFVKKQQAVFLDRLPKITQQVNADTAFKAFSEVDKMDDMGETIEQQLATNTEVLGNTIGAQVTSKAYLDNIELAIANGDVDRARDMIEELDSTDIANFGSQGKRKINGIEIFNTKENRLRLEDLEDKLEEAGVRNYQVSVNNSKIATSAIDVELFRIIQNEGEEAGLAYLKDIEQGIVDGTVTVGGKQYDDTVELQGIRDFVAGVKSNKDLFVYNSKLRFIQSNAQSKRTAVKQLLTQGALASINQEAAGLLLKVKPNPVTGAMDVVYSPEGVSFLSEFNAELERLEFALHDSIASLPEADKIDKFSELYPSEVNEAMKSWVAGKLDSLLVSKPEPEKQSRIDSLVSQEDQEEINSNPLISQADKEAILNEMADEQEALQIASNFMTNPDGTRELRDASSMSYTGSVQANTAALKRSFTRASAQEQWKDGAEKASGLDTVHSRLSERPFSYSPKGTTLRDLYARTYKASLNKSLIKRAEKAGEFREQLSVFGVTADELLNDSFSGVRLVPVFGDQGPFLTTPVIINGSMSNTIKVVQDYLKNPDAPEDIKMKMMASQYQMSVDTMMRQMESYLLQNGYLK